MLWAYDGFADLAFAAGEVKDPQRTLPRAIIGGTLAIIAIYLAANVAYLYVNPIERLARSPLIAADTMQAIVGRFGVAFVSVVVTISTFGALIGIMLTAPRVFFAMADDGLFFKAIARVHPRYQHAVRGHLARRAARRRVRADADVRAARRYVRAVDLAVLRARHRRPLPPAAARPTCHGRTRFPATRCCPPSSSPASSYLVGNALITDPLWTSVTFAIVLAGVPVYYVFFATKNMKT